MMFLELNSETAVDKLVINLLSKRGLILKTIRKNLSKWPNNLKTKRSLGNLRRT